MITFRISNTSVQLPCLIEKARYNDVDAWFIALVWEYKSGISISHVAAVVFKYGTHEVLFAASCA